MASAPSRGWTYSQLLEERRTPIHPPTTPTDHAIREVCRILSRAMWDADRRRTRP